MTKREAERMLRAIAAGLAAALAERGWSVAELAVHTGLEQADIEAVLRAEPSSAATIAGLEMALGRRLWPERPPPH
jgi:lambda repressor-like predicted transcriptional regulator